MAKNYYVEPVWLVGGRPMSYKEEMEMIRNFKRFISDMDVYEELKKYPKPETYEERLDQINKCKELCEYKRAEELKKTFMNFLQG